MRLHLQDVWDIYKISESTGLAVEAPTPPPPTGLADDVTASESHQTLQCEFLLRWGTGQGWSLLGRAFCSSVCQTQPASWAGLFWVPLTCFGGICKF